MAIEFLNSVDFNQNQIVAPAIESLAAAPGAPVEGQMYFDSTVADKTIYFWNGTSWVAMDGSSTGVTTFTNANGTFISATTVNTAATGAVTVGTLDLSATGTAGATTFLRGDNTWATPTDTDTTYTLPTTNGANPDLVLTASSGGTDIVNLNGVGTTVKVTGSTLNTITFDLVDDVTIVTSLTVNSGAAATRSSFGYQVTIPATPLVSTDAASKGYVDGLVEGGLTFKGTFNASSGIIVSGSETGSYLYNCPGGAGTRVVVTTGDYYVVATAGDFYCSATYPLTIGDSIIGVEDAAADTSVVGDWSIVQSDEGVTDFTNANGTFISAGTVNTGATSSVTMGTIDLSASGTPGVTNFLRGDNTWAIPTGAVTSVTASATNDELGAIISPTTGAVVVGVDIQSQTALAAAPALSDELLIYDNDASTNKKITVENLMQSATNGAYAVLNTSTTGVTQQSTPPAGTEGWVIAVDTILSATAAIHVACEVIRVSDGATVITQVSRATTNITVNFVGSSIVQGTYAVILNRVA